MKMTNIFRYGVIAAVVFLGMAGTRPVWGQTPPGLMNFQGRLTDAGNNPLSGPHDFVFGIYDALSGGSQLWTEVQNGVPVANGVMAAQLGAGTAIPPSVFKGASAYLQITVDGVPLSPRQRLITSPYAFNAYNLAGRDYTAFVSTDAAAQTIAGDKTFTGTLTITSLAAAQLRLAGNVIISSETLPALGAGIRVSTNIYIVGFSSAAKYYGDGSALTGVSGSDNLGDHTATTNLNMSGNQILNVSSLTVTGKDAASGYSLFLSSGINMPAGTINAGRFIGDGRGLYNVLASSVAAGAINTPAHITDALIPLAKLNQSGCANNQVPKWNGAAWACGDDNGGTTYTADEVSLHLSAGVFSAHSSSVTLQGNSFNGANQLVRLTGGGALPALNGAALTNVNAAQFTAVATDTTTIAGNLAAEATARSGGDTTIGVTTGTLRADLNAVITSTAPLANAANWNTAYTWGDHAGAGYAAAADLGTLAQSTGPLVNYVNWNAAFGWGNHALAGYANGTAIGIDTATLRTDLNAVITSTAPLANAANWNTAYAWGDHALAGYTNGSAIGVATATLRTDLDAVITSTAPLANAADWNTAYTWGDHAGAGYATAADLGTLAQSTGPLVNYTNWNTAYGWGNHTLAGYARLSAAQTLTGSNIFTSTTAFTSQNASIPGITISSGLVISNGNVGIGTESPGVKLQVAGDIVAHGQVFRAYMTADFAKTAGTWEVIPFNATLFNTLQGTFDTGAHRFTASRAGYYRISVTGYSSTPYTTFGDRYAIGAAKNGTLEGFTGGIYAASDSPLSGLSSLIVYLNGSTDYVEMRAFSVIAATWKSGTTNGHQMFWYMDYMGNATGDVACGESPAGGGSINIVDTLSATLGAGNDAAGLNMVNLGNVGIGTTNPATKLHVAGDVQVGDLTASTISASGHYTFAGISQPTAAPGRVYYDSAAKKLRLSTGALTTDWVDLSTGGASGAWSGFGGGGTQWVKIYNEDVTSAKTSITIPGLSGDSDVAYKIITRFVNTGAGANYYVRPNNDTNTTNYGIQELYGVGAGVGAYQATTYSGLMLVSSAGGARATVEAMLLAKSGQERVLMSKAASGVNGTTVGGEYTHSTAWNNTASNITSLVIVASLADAIGAGSHIEVWTQGNPSGPVQWITTGNDIYYSAGNVGIGTSGPLSKLDVQAAGSTPTDFVQIWRDSGGTVVSSVSATGVMMATKFIGDGSGLSGVNTADTLGTHVATTTLNMNGFGLVSVATMTFAGISQPTAAPGRVYYDSAAKKLRLSTGTLTTDWVDLSTGGASGAWSGFGGGGTQWVKIYNEDVTTAKDSITIPGLSGDSDVAYKISVRMVNNSGATSIYTVKPNNDTTAANYFDQYLIGQGGSPIAGTSSNVAGFRLGYQAAATRGMFEATVLAKSGQERAMISHYIGGISGASLANEVMESSVWNNTASNITSLVLQADQINGIGVGSHIEVWTQGNPSGPVQWITTGNDIYYSAGNVGIGTSGPATTLDVNGSAQFGSGTTKSGFTATGNLQLVSGSTITADGTLTLSTAASAATATPNLFINSAGKVGIGTASPATSLDIRGDTSGTDTSIRLANSDYLAGSTGSGFYVRTGATTGNTWTEMQTFHSGNTAVDNLVLQRYGGNIGIAKTDPGYTLDVNGAINATSVLINGVAVGAGGTQWASGVGGIISYTGGNVGIGTTSPSPGGIVRSLDIRGSTDRAALVVYGDAGDTDATPQSDVSFNSTGNAGQAGVGGDRIALIRAITQGTTVGNRGGSLAFYTKTDGGSGTITEGLRINNTGNVGIGTAAPDYKLEVQDTGAMSFQVNPQAGYVSLRINGVEVARMKP